MRAGAFSVSSSDSAVAASSQSFVLPLYIWYSLRKLVYMRLSIKKDHIHCSQSQKDILKQA